MKTLKLTLAVVLTAGLFYSCQEENLEKEGPVESAETLKQVEQKFLDLGVNPSGGIEPFIMDNEDGTSESGWLSHDIFLSKDDLVNMPALPQEDDADAEKLIRTRNLVRVPSSGKRTLRVVGRNNLPANAKEGLRRAVQNYNQLNLRFRMQLSFGNGNGNIRVLYRPNELNPGGGVAGFPRNGNPFGTVKLGSTAGLDLRTTERLITHELGHCVGLRHSDYRIRFQCRNAGNEGQTEYGAIRVPGTNGSGRVTNAVMRACYASSTPVNFTNDERTGLRRIY